MAGSIAGKAGDARPETGRLRRPWGTLTIRYVPRAKLAELKSLRDFLTAFRERRIFQEEVVNEVLDELVASVQPHFAEVEGAFNMRGGMTTRAVARHGEDPT